MTIAGPYLFAPLFANIMSFIYFPRSVVIKQVIILATDIFMHELTVS